MKKIAVAITLGAGSVLVSLCIAPGAKGLVGGGLALVAVAIAWVDYQDFTIPDAFNAAGIGLAFLHAGLAHPEAIVPAVGFAALRGAVLACIFFAIRQIYLQLRGRQGLGLGDVKLAAVAGAWLDWITMPVVVEIATLAALATYLFRQYVMNRPFIATHRLPFGVFFAPAIWLCWAVQTAWPQEI
jgi:leader peptidase (prepilin peptidase)/N-methyltransferase